MTHWKTQRIITNQILTSSQQLPLSQVSACRGVYFAAELILRFFAYQRRHHPKRMLLMPKRETLNAILKLYAIVAWSSSCTRYKNTLQKHHLIKYIKYYILEAYGSQCFSHLVYCLGCLSLPRILKTCLPKFGWVASIFLGGDVVLRLQQEHMLVVFFVA